MFSLSREAATAAVTTVGPPSASKAQPRPVLAPAEAQAPPPRGHWLCWPVRLLTCFSFKTSLVWGQETLFGRGQGEAGGGQRCTPTSHPAPSSSLPCFSGCLTGEGSPSEYHGGGGAAPTQSLSPALLMGPWANASLLRLWGLHPPAPHSYASFPASFSAFSLSL